MSLPINSSQKVCSRCAAPFVCLPDNISQCDCQAVELSCEETQFISGQFKDCVCNACLRELKELYNKPRPKAIFSWSGGKDSAYALHKILAEQLYEVKYLLTSINGTFKRISMHGVREELLDLQAQSIGIPLLKAEVYEGTNLEYEIQMAAILLRAKSEGINHVIFGDIFLEDLRAYREANLAKVNMKAVFPLWQEPTTALVNQFIAQQFKTVVCCTNDAYLDKEWLGREIDQSFVAQLPKDVDPCGENGEYHTFCYDGPVFKKKILFSAGEKLYKPLELKFADNSESFTGKVTQGFWFIDLLPTSL